eukprot:1139835-Pelagomonas_calceolata.AAC.2
MDSRLWRLPVLKSLGSWAGVICKRTGRDRQEQIERQQNAKKCVQGINAVRHGGLMQHWEKSQGQAARDGEKGDQIKKVGNRIVHTVHLLMRKGKVQQHRSEGRAH